MSKSLDGKTALVTGGGGPAMGSAHCLALAKLGAHVIVQDMREDHAASVVADIHAYGGSAEPMAGDITKLDPFLVSLSEVISSTGGIDILVNHAGISGLSTPLADIDQDFFNRMMDVHVKGSFFITQAVVPGMKAKEYGKIINIASEFCLYGSPSASHYTAAKSALLGLTKSWARELAPFGIRVNAVAPSLMESELTRASVGDAFLKAQGTAAPFGRLAVPDDIAGVVAFLAGPESDFISGQTISPNGGNTIVGI
jgi:3-oxoacyl-[acyl-carrier protein] reductase